MLRKRLGEIANKKADKAATVGAIGSYVHVTDGIGKVGVLLDLGCNTDFVAKNPDYTALLRELAIGVAAFNPQYVTKDQIPADLLETEKAKFAGDVKGKPPEIAAKIIDGKLEKNVFSQLCLMHMTYPKEDVFKGTYGDYVKQFIGKLGENIVVRRFVRMELGR